MKKCIPFLMILSLLFSRGGDSVTSEYYLSPGSNTYSMRHFSLGNIDSSKNNAGKAMLLSLALPGAGQIYNGSPWWKPALFFSAEALGIVGAIKWKQSSENIRKQFESLADNHWTLDNWYNQTQKIFPDQWEEVLVGTHKFAIIIDGNRYYSDQILTLIKDYPLAEMRVTRDRDFYENIGKYDQFVGGWDDPYDDPHDETGNWFTLKKGSSEETIILTKQKDVYRNLRHESNVDKNKASYAVTALMFNHIASGLEALWSAKNKTEPAFRVSVRMTLDPTPINSFGLGGVRMVVSW